MHICNLIKVSHVKGRLSKRMQILDESTKAFLNFKNSPHSDLVDLVKRNS
jgi:hypothetical protein